MARRMLRESFAGKEAARCVTHSRADAPVQSLRSSQRGHKNGDGGRTNGG